MAEQCGLTVVNVYCEKLQGKWNKKHAACVERCLYDIYTEISFRCVKTGYT